jgi:hypothetical protein
VVKTVQLIIRIRILQAQEAKSLPKVEPVGLLTDRIDDSGVPFLEPCLEKKS